MSAQQCLHWTCGYGAPANIILKSNLVALSGFISTLPPASKANRSAAHLPAERKVEMDYQKKYFTLRRALEKIENIGVEHPAEDTSLRMFRIANYALRDDDDDAVEQKLHPTPESLASSQAVSNASTLEQSDGESNPAQAQVS